MGQNLQNIQNSIKQGKLMFKRDRYISETIYRSKWLEKILLFWIFWENKFTIEHKKPLIWFVIYVFRSGTDSTWQSQSASTAKLAATVLHVLQSYHSGGSTHARKIPHVLHWGITKGVKRGKTPNISLPFPRGWGGRGATNDKSITLIR